MKVFTVKLNAWTSPVLVQATNKKRAEELALAEYPTCDCCGAPTHIESATKALVGGVPYYQRVLIEVIH